MDQRLDVSYSDYEVFLCTFCTVTYQISVTGHMLL
jgi:hypothetical protein